MKTNVLLAALAILLALIVVAERWRPSPTADAGNRVAARPLLGVREDQLLEIRVVSSNVCIDIRLRPVTGTAEQSLQRLVDLLVHVPELRRFAAVPDLGPYGLETTSRRLEIASADGRSPRVLYLGDLSPTGNAMYARAEDPSTVLLVGTYFVNELAILVREVETAGIASVRAACPG